MPGRQRTTGREGALADLECLRATLAAAAPKPADVFVIGEPVTLVSIDFDGNVSRGITASVTADACTRWCSPT